MRRGGAVFFLSVILDKGSKSTFIVASPREKCFIKGIQNKLTWLFVVLLNARSLDRI